MGKLSPEERFQLSEYSKAIPWRLAGDTDLTIAGNNEGTKTIKMTTTNTKSIGLANAMNTFYMHIERVLKLTW